MSFLLHAVGSKRVTKANTDAQGYQRLHFSMVDCEGDITGEHVGWEILLCSFLEKKIHLHNFLRITSISLVVPLLFSLLSFLNPVLRFVTGLKAL